VRNFSTLLEKSPLEKSCTLESEILEIAIRFEFGICYTIANVLNVLETKLAGIADPWLSHYLSTPYTY
jgi:hypothetical protein